jgi:outer membrane lipoprotein-sorting protein
MKIKQLFFLLITTTVLAAPLSAQTNIQKAKKILNKLSKPYKSHKSIKAGFTITTTNPDKSKMSQKGTIWVKKKFFRIDMRDQEIMCDGKTIWTWQKEVNEVQIKKYAPSSREIQPSQLFTIWEQGFNYLWAGKVTQGGVKADVIDLVPKTGKEGRDYSKVKLYVDGSKNQIMSATIIKKNGVKISYTLTSQNTKQRLTKANFKMDTKAKQKAGAEIVDLR